MGGDGRDDGVRAGLSAAHRCATQTQDDLESAEACIEAVRAAVLSQLSSTPYSFRKAGKSPTRRELIIPFGATGYVALCEIASLSSVVVLAVRHQREEDYH